MPTDNVNNVDDQKDVNMKNKSRRKIREDNHKKDMCINFT